MFFIFSGGTDVLRRHYILLYWLMQKLTTAPISDYSFLCLPFSPKALQYRSPADLQPIIEEQTKDLAIA
jgi:hypothetical protein